MLGDEHPPTLLEGNFHHLGATRMHTDPAQGVVDADCRVHAIRNLYVTGGSVFPTYGSPIRPSRWWRWLCGWPTT